MPAARDRLLVALDFDAADKALSAVRLLQDHVGGFKVGKELFVTAGPDLTRLIARSGARVFLDLKFHDIPNTVAQAVSAATRLGVWMINIHASGGPAMCRAAVEAAGLTAAQLNRPAPLIIGVTILTSLDQTDLARIGMQGHPKEAALRLAGLAHEAGLDGVVAGAEEAAAIKQKCGADFLVVTPGIRPAGEAVGDQKRVMTPADALRNGSDFLVVGRPITQAADPVAAADKIVAEIETFEKG